MLALGAYFGGARKIFWCTEGGLLRLQNKTAPEPKKNILVILVYLCSRPAQGGGAGLVRYYHQNKTVPEPPLHILLEVSKRFEIRLDHWWTMLEI